jgi:hypothetical protein
MEFIMEKVLTMATSLNERNVRFIIESRGGSHDALLRDVFYGYLRKGTRFRSAERFKSAFFEIEFAPKHKNVIGTQISDLMAFPIAQNILTPGYRGYLSVEPKIYHPAWLTVGQGKPENWRYGLKIFP